MTQVYTAIEEQGLSSAALAQNMGITEASVVSIYEGYKQYNYIGYAQQPIVMVPAWSEVIHLVDEKKIDPEEYRRRTIERIRRIQRSPTPEIANNIATILTAIDDVNDFCTTIGVGARIIEKTLKLPNVVSKGFFTVKELTDSMALMNRIPFEKMNIDAIIKMIKDSRVDLDAIPHLQKRQILKELYKRHPNWSELSIAKQQAFMREHWKMTRDRWGMPLKKKKQMAEMFYSKGTPWGKLAAEVEKKLMRTLPNHGELIEMSQTSDQIAGVGLSLGPIVGLAMDLLFSRDINAKIEFAEWHITKEELHALKFAAARIAKFPVEMKQHGEAIGNALAKATIALAAGEDTGVEEFLKATWVSTQAYIMMRGKEVKGAVISIWDTLSKNPWGLPKRTSSMIKSTLLSEGINPHRIEGWPGTRLTRAATLQEISDAYLEKIPKVINFYQRKLSGTIEGEFLSACLSAIAFATADFCAAEGAPIRETFTPELAIFTRACDAGLEPPIWATEEEFAAWHAWLMEKMTTYQAKGPEYKWLQEAREKFWPISIPEE